MPKKNDSLTGIDKKPTIRDVSRLAGVSTATVSRILANYDVVSEATRQRVNAAIQELNFTVNRNARNLRRSKLTKIGVLITDVQNPFFGSIVRGIEKTMITQDYTIFLGNSDEDVNQENKILNLFLEEGVAGIVLVPASSENTQYIQLFSSSIPTVIIDRKINNASTDSVFVDNYTGTAQATEALIRLGHRNIALISGLKHLSVMQEREKGFLDALHKHDLKPNPNLLKNANNRQDGGFAAMKELLSFEQPPTAVLISNNLMTLGGLEAVHQSALRIPDDISIIGFDDMDWACSLQPLFFFKQKTAYEMGEKAAKLLLERIREPGLPPRKIILQTELILRESCKPIVSTSTP